MTELRKIQDLYDRNLFLQAYQQSADYWSPSTSLKCLSTDELILGGRLAGALRRNRRVGLWLDRGLGTLFIALGLRLAASAR